MAALPLLAKQRPKSTKNPSRLGAGKAFRWERAVPLRFAESRGEAGGPSPGAAVAQGSAETPGKHGWGRRLAKHGLSCFLASS